MANIAQPGAERGVAAQASAVSTCSPSAAEKSATRTDTALLVAALFLPRFSLPFHTTALQLDLVAIGSILLYQFLRGKLRIQYDRLLWLLPFALATTASLLLNFNGGMLTSYAQSMTFFSLFALRRPSTPDQYKKTLQAFQFLVLLLSCIAIAQIPAQLVVPPEKLINLWGIVPAFSTAQVPAVHFRADGIFLPEASSLSQITALGILVELLEFRRLRYLIVIALGFLVAYSGTGAMLLLLFLPVAGLTHNKAGLAALLVVIFALGLFATGIIDLSVWSSRAGEFETPGTSGYERFASPFWLAAKAFDTGSWAELLLGSGPGTAKIFAAAWVNSWYTGGFTATWIKILYENGIIGSFIFACFLAACLRRSRCPGLVIAAIIFAWLFLQGMMTFTIALCTLSGPEPRRVRIAETHDRSSLGAAAKTV